jgi:cation diffusion facilitator family transporter
LNTKADISRENRALIVALLSQVAIAAIKLGYGYYASLVSMQADGYHSLLDGASSLIGLAGVWMARRPPDREHPYGHGKFEYLTTMGISMMLFYTAYQVSTEAYHRFASSVVPNADPASFAIIIGTIGVNWVVCNYQIRVGREVGSDILVADATHTRSDIWASMAVLVALVAIRLGFPILDPICAIFIVILIVGVGYEIVKESFQVLTDTAIIDPRRVKQVVLSVEGVRGCHRVRTRGTRQDVHIDLHLAVDGGMPMSECYDVTKAVEERVKEQFDGVTEVLVRLEPQDQRSGT